MNTRIYMDYNATAPLRLEAREVMLRALDSPRNASSVHSYGREARQMVEEARENIARLVGVPAAQVIFNSGATEGNNTVLQYFAGERVLVSAIEHPSVLEATAKAEIIPVTPEGVVNLEALEQLLKEKPAALVSVMMVNNETGIIQPIDKISALAKKHGALLHCDGVQAVGRTPINLNTQQIDFLTLSAHKIGGPQGVGALALGLCGITPTLLHGGGQEKKARAGTENVAGIAGFGAAAKLAADDLGTGPQKIGALRDRLEKELSASGVKIYGQNIARVCNTSMFSLPGARAESLLMALDLDGIALSNGSACSSGTVQPSHVLRAMGTSDTEASSALRISLGWDSKESDIEHFLTAWARITERLNNKAKSQNA